MCTSHEQQLQSVMGGGLKQLQEKIHQHMEKKNENKNLLHQHNHNLQIFKRRKGISLFSQSVSPSIPLSRQEFHDDPVREPRGTYENVSEIEHITGKV